MLPACLLAHRPAAPTLSPHQTIAPILGDAADDWDAPGAAPTNPAYPPEPQHAGNAGWGGPPPPKPPAQQSGGWGGAGGYGGGSGGNYGAGGYGAPPAAPQQQAWGGAGDGSGGDASPEVNCPTCAVPCAQRTSNTQKNPGRGFFKCQVREAPWGVDWPEPSCSPCLCP